MTLEHCPVCCSSRLRVVDRPDPLVVYACSGCLSQFTMPAYPQLHRASTRLAIALRMLALALEPIAEGMKPRANE